MSPPTRVELKPGAYKTDLKPVWCPGCGDYAILKAVQKAMPNIGIRKENVVFKMCFIRP